MEVILFEPDIPQNTGNIARTCVATNARLTLIRPLGFALNSRHLKRSGMDYWNLLELNVVDNISTVIKQPFYFFSTKGKKNYTDIKFEKNAQLIFGSETKGFSQEIYTEWEEHLYRIPMAHHARSLNLSNAVAIVLYEALRQIKVLQ